MLSKYWDESAELDKLAELSIKTGVALQSGQDLLITAPLEAAPLVRRLAFHAYKQGCGIVTPLYTCLLYTSPSPRDRTRSRMPSSA